MMNWLTGNWLALMAAVLSILAIGLTLFEKWWPPRLKVLGPAYEDDKGKKHHSLEIQVINYRLVPLRIQRAGVLFGRAEEIFHVVGESAVGIGGGGFPFPASSTTISGYDSKVFRESAEQIWNSFFQQSEMYGLELPGVGCIKLRPFVVDGVGRRYKSRPWWLNVETLELTKILFT